MNQLDINYSPKLPESRKFDGPEFEPAREAERLGKQHETIRYLMLAASQYSDGWRTLKDIAAVTGYPESSISAQLRHLRNPRFGGYTVERRHVSRGLFEYRVSK